MALALVLLAALATPAQERHETRHMHARVTLDSALTLAGTVDAALARYPDRPTLDARAREAQAWRDRGHSWLSGRPALQLRYQTDHFGANLNLEEFESGIQLPLWAWGGRRAVQDFGEALSAESVAAAQALRWQVAGQVRAALWRVALAQNDRDLAAQALVTGDRLVQLVERRHQLGDVAQRDVLLARTAHLQRQTALIEADASLVDAERDYFTLTALDRHPEFVPEPLSERDAIGDEHPVLAFANAALTRADANVERAERATRGGANVQIGTRRERPALGTELDDSVGVTVSVPFGGDTHRQPQISAAARTAADARAELERQRRALTSMLHEAEHGLHVTDQSLEVARQRLDLAERHRRMGELAYETGEVALTDLLKMQAAEIDAQRQVTRLAIDRNRQIASYNQAVGVLP